jgi:hypothetical protein
MSQRIKKHAETLMIMKKACPKLRKELIKRAGKDLIFALCECSLNVLNGNVKLQTGQKKKLKRHCKGLRSLADKKVSLSKKKKILQTGGILPALLAPIAASVLGPILGGLLSR